MDIFVYDKVNGTLKIDEYSILLIKEFENLWDSKRNKCKEDKEGVHKLRAFQELKYIYLVLDWKSPYFQYKERDKHGAALLDSKLTEDDLKDEIFKAAYNKYLEIQESDRVLSLIKTGLRTLTKVQVFLDSIDFNTDVDRDGKPLFKPKEIIADIASIASMRKNLLELEVEHKKGLVGKTIVRGDNEVGWNDI